MRREGLHVPGEISNERRICMEIQSKSIKRHRRHAIITWTHSVNQQMCVCHSKLKMTKHQPFCPFWVIFFNGLKWNRKLKVCEMKRKANWNSYSDMIWRQQEVRSVCVECTDGGNELLHVLNSATTWALFLTDFPKAEPRRQRKLYMKESDSVWVRPSLGTYLGYLPSSGCNYCNDLRVFLRCRLLHQQQPICLRVQQFQSGLDARTSKERGMLALGSPLS